MRILLVLIVFILSCPSVLSEEIALIQGKHCVVTKDLNLDRLVTSAGIIFRGQFKSYESKEEDGLSVRELKFSVIDNIKGIEDDTKTLILKEWAKTNSPFSSEDVDKDTEYVFFFNTPSSRGLTSLVGMEQGLVEILKSDQLKYSRRLSIKQNNSMFNRLSFLTRTDDFTCYKGLKDFCEKNQ
jgi:hypothetical protein